MTIYAAEADLKRYIDSSELTALKTDSDGSTADIAALLTETSAMIDGALRNAGYVVPIASPGADVRSLAARLALGALYGRRQQVGAAELVKLAIEQAHDELLAIGKGNLTLTGAVKVTAGGESPGGIAVRADADRGWGESELF